MLLRAAGLVMVALNLLTARAQSVENVPTSTFEVASIKLNPGCAGKAKGVSVSPERLELSCVNLKYVIETAYGVFADGRAPNLRPIEITGGPSWVDSDYYDFMAKAESNALLAQMQGPMLQKLLENRFRLMLHHDTKAVPVYALTVSKSGLKMKPSKDGSCTPVDVNHLPPPPAPGQSAPAFCGRPTPGTKGGNITMDVRGMTMAELADGLLSRILDRTVVDKTGLTAMFDFHLEFTPDGVTPMGGGPQPVSPAEPGLSVFTAVSEQLGLKLEPDLGTMGVLVIDHIERPSAN